MNIYDAIMQAADRIEANPQRFNYLSCDKPNDCGTPGCALGWIGLCSGTKEASPDYAWQVAMDVLKLTSPFKFYDQMDDVAGFLRDWRGSAKECAKTLRLYAKKYHGHEKPKAVTTPDWKAMSAKWTVGDDVKSQDAFHV